MGAGLARERPATPAGRIPERWLAALLKGLWDPAGKRSLPFAGGARSHKARSYKRSSCSRVKMEMVSVASSNTTEAWPRRNCSRTCDTLVSVPISCSP